MEKIKMVEIEGILTTVFNYDQSDKDKYFGFIYVTHNKLDGMYYLGQHSGWNKNYLGSSKTLWNDLRKYDRAHFERYIIDFSEDEEDLNRREVYFQSRWKVDKNTSFYNKRITSSGGGKVKEVTKKKISMNNSMYQKSVREKVSKTRTGIIFTDEWKENLSASLKGKTAGKKNGSAKAVAVYKNNELIRNFDTVHEATIWARENGITNKRYLIQSLTNNLPIIYKTKSSKYPNGNGFLFRYDHSKMELRKANE